MWKRDRLLWGIALGLGLLFVLPTAAASAGSAAPTTNPQFNHAGNVLITDQFNNRVIEVNPLTKQIVWSFGSGNSTLCNPGPGTIIGTNDAERLAGGITLISGTGIPAGIPGTTACVDNRVIAVNPAGKIIWQYGQAGKTGSGPNLLNVPVYATQLANHDILITDQANNRVIEVSLHHRIVWSYGSANGSSPLNGPNSAIELANGDFLIADQSNNRAIEVNHAHQIVWSYSKGLLTVAFASRLPNGDTLIVDSGHSRVVEIASNGTVVWQYFTNHGPKSNAAPLPTNAVRLAGGDTMIADQFNDRVIVVNPAHQIVWQYGQTNSPGTGFSQLYGPYTGFVVGDYTGVTPPPATF
ncbi:MAG TPA: hypothetical protein VGV89_05730 [Thermoplasmata archaeon]|nr:hypothetical protein [Thermoplasmata archaeon]